MYGTKVLGHSFGNWLCKECMGVIKENFYVDFRA